jgi:very-short-patch-repair endonuclease
MYKRAKVERNRERDAATDALLGQVGWNMLQFSEHQITADIATAVQAAVASEVRRDRPAQLSLATS